MVNPRDKQRLVAEDLEPAAQAREETQVNEETANQPVEKPSQGEAAKPGEEMGGISPEEQQAAARQLAMFLEEVAKDRETLEETKKELAAFENRYARLQADFDNYKRRTRQEKEELARFAAEGVISNLLPVLDNFERALAVEKTEGIAGLYDGVEMIYRQLLAVLAQEGLQPMVSVGQEFDPNLHDAVTYGEATAEFADDTVMTEIKKGYLLKDKVIRHAIVRVAKGSQ
ncbi:MAG: nucleotide exchange factor GrpE [Heliobacteriaceae bacterium]|nr:nucleotide exchange factor GrpE [Heliobacteriaceae bacterium]MDD4586868.1 nucleotide exchange factor GrpE [Heliobacteriaceae bacterium]